MAITTSNALNTVLTRYVEGIRMVDESYMQTFDLRTTDDAALRVASLTGIGAIPAWDGTSAMTTAAFDSSGAATFTYANKAVQVRIPKRLSQDIPELAGDAAVKLGTATAATMKVLATAAFSGSFSSVQTADGKALCATDHARAAGTRSNLLTSALDYDGLWAAIALSREYTSYQSLEYDLTDLGFYLVVGSSNERAGKEILGSALSGASNQFNAAGAFNIELVVLNGLTDPDDWWLVSKAETPLLFWLRSAPMMNVVTDQDTGALKLNLDFAYAVGAKPLPDGIIGSNVA